MKWGWLLASGGLVALGLSTPQGKQAVKTVMDKKDLELDFFTASEFGIWWPVMSNDLLVKLDRFRFYWGDEVTISGALGAIGRDNDPTNSSQHNVLKWGEVRAIDCHPKGMVSASDRKRAYDKGKLAGFTGIGIYPDWNTPGIHLDVRQPLQQGVVASWSAFFDEAGKQIYYEIARAFG